MGIFPALGLAVLGIFSTIILSGILAGIIAFGLIDLGYRRRIQAHVVKTLLLQPVASFLEADPRFEQTNDGSWWGIASLIALRIRHNRLDLEGVLPKPLQLFNLPYRQLCGQIANVLSEEAFRLDKATDQNFEEPVRPALAPLTLALTCAWLSAKGRDIRPFPFIVARTRALDFLDTIQIALADAILRVARFIAGMVVLVIFLAILLPNLDALNVFAMTQSSIARSLGAMIGIFVALLLAAVLAFAATIVSTLTFRWIDRVASAR